MFTQLGAGGGGAGRGGKKEQNEKIMSKYYFIKRP